MPTTTNMVLDLPDVSVTAGPTWASDLNTALTAVDEHDHTTNKGVPVPTAGININADLPMNSNDLTEVRSINYDNQSAVFSSSSDNRSTYVRSGELYFRDNSGNNVQITSAGAVNVSGSNGIGGDYGGANPASVFYTDATDLYSFTTDPGVFANLKYRGLELTGKCVFTTQTVTTTPFTVDDAATDASFVLLVNTSSAKTIELPDPTTEHRILIIKDITGTSETNNITLDLFGSETIDGVSGNKTLARNFGTWIIISNGTNWFMLRDDANDMVVYDGTSTASQNEAIGTSFASLTIATTTFTSGSAITRSSNDITCGKSGDYLATVTLSRLTKASGNTAVMARVRDTTAGATKGISAQMLASETIDTTQTVTIPFTVTAPGNTLQIQVAGLAAAFVQNGAAIDSETSPIFRYQIQYLGR